MSDKKIGILTYWGVPNYGAWIQAYALNKVLDSIYHEQCDIIHLNYLCDHHWKSYYINDKKLFNAFSYSWNVIPHSKRLDEESIEDYFCDVIVTGADSIWEFSVPEMGKDCHLIGNGLKCKRLVSYAASFGVTSIEDITEEWVRTGLERYDSILVRDAHSKDVICGVCPSKTPIIVVDPCMLWDFLHDEAIINPTYNNYYVVYGYEFGEEFKRSVVERARKEKKTLISIGYVNSWCDVNLKMVELRCLEWLGLVKNADCVVTSMFHGLMSGLSFEKQIMFEQVDYVKNRSQTLIDILGISKIATTISANIDYSDVSTKIFKLRQESLEQLKKAIGDI